MQAHRFFSDSKAGSLCSTNHLRQLWFPFAFLLLAVTGNVGCIDSPTQNTLNTALELPETAVVTDTATAHDGRHRALFLGANGNYFIAREASKTWEVKKLNLTAKSETVALAAANLVVLHTQAKSRLMILERRTLDGAPIASTPLKFWSDDLLMSASAHGKVLLASGHCDSRQQRNSTKTHATKAHACAVVIDEQDQLLWSWGFGDNGKPLPPIAHLLTARNADDGSAALLFSGRKGGRLIVVGPGGDASGTGIGGSFSSGALSLANGKVGVALSSTLGLSIQQLRTKGGLTTFVFSKNQVVSQRGFPSQSGRVFDAWLAPGGVSILLAASPNPETKPKSDCPHGTTLVVPNVPQPFTTRCAANGPARFFRDGTKISSAPAQKALHW